MCVNGNGLMDTFKPPLYSHDKFMTNSSSFEQVVCSKNIYVTVKVRVSKTLTKFSEVHSFLIWVCSGAHRCAQVITTVCQQTGSMLWHQLQTVSIVSRPLFIQKMHSNVQFQMK